MWDVTTGLLTARSKEVCYAVPSAESHADVVTHTNAYRLRTKERKNERTKERKDERTKERKNNEKRTYQRRIWIHDTTTHTTSNFRTTSYRTQNLAVHKLTLLPSTTTLFTSTFLPFVTWFSPCTFMRRFIDRGPVFSLQFFPEERKKREKS